MIDPVFVFILQGVIGSDWPLQPTRCHNNTTTQLMIVVQCPWYNSSWVYLPGWHIADYTVNVIAFEGWDFHADLFLLSDNANLKMYYHMQIGSDPKPYLNNLYTLTIHQWIRDTLVRCSILEN